MEESQIQQVTAYDAKYSRPTPALNVAREFLPSVKCWLLIKRFKPKKLSWKSHLINSDKIYPKSRHYYVMVRVPIKQSITRFVLLNEYSDNSKNYFGFLQPVKQLFSKNRCVNFVCDF